MKTPNHRRLKKWKKRAEHVVLKAPTRGFVWFMSETIRCQPMFRAARRANVDLLERFNPLPPLSQEQLFDCLESFILGSTKRNLEI